MENTSLLVHDASPFQPEPSRCANKWCNNLGNVPATGQRRKVAECGDVQTMEWVRDTSGGVTGRGVTPCPFGFVQRNVGNDLAFLLPYQGYNFYRVSPTSVFFDPARPTFLPPQGNPRPLTRVGYEWRNTT